MYSCLGNSRALVLSDRSWACLLAFMRCMPCSMLCMMHNSAQAVPGLSSRLASKVMVKPELQDAPFAVHPLLPWKTL